MLTTLSWALHCSSQAQHLGAAAPTIGAAASAAASPSTKSRQPCPQAHPGLSPGSPGNHWARSWRTAGRRRTARGAAARLWAAHSCKGCRRAHHAGIAAWSAVLCWCGHSKAVCACMHACMHACWSGHGKGITPQPGQNGHCCRAPSSPSPASLKAGVQGRCAAAAPHALPGACLKPVSLRPVLLLPQESAKARVVQGTSTTPKQVLLQGNAAPCVPTQRPSSAAPTRLLR